MQKKKSLLDSFRSTKNGKDSSVEAAPNRTPAAPKLANRSSDSYTQASIRVFSTDASTVGPRRGSGAVPPNALSAGKRSVSVAMTPTGFGLREDDDATDSEAARRSSTVEVKKKGPKSGGMLRALSRKSYGDGSSATVAKEGPHPPANQLAVRPRLLRIDKLTLPMDVLLKSLLKIRSKDGKTTRYFLLLILI